MMVWHPIGEKLPPILTEVIATVADLCGGKSRVVCGIYRQRENPPYGWRHIPRDHVITHWMPIPGPADSAAGSQGK